MFKNSLDWFWNCESFPLVSIIMQYKSVSRIIKIIITLEKIQIETLKIPHRNYPFLSSFFIGINNSSLKDSFPLTNCL